MNSGQMRIPDDQKLTDLIDDIRSYRHACTTLIINGRVGGPSRERLIEETKDRYDTMRLAMEALLRWFDEEIDA